MLYRFHTIFFFIIALVLNTKIMAIETPKYRTLIKEGKFEVRDYDPMVIAKTSVNSNYSNAASTGFRRIANYIFGGNKNQMNIAMTAPVILNTPSSKNDYDILFVMPKEYSLDDLPLPNYDNIKLQTKELGKTAVISFGGWATEDRSVYYRERLKDFVKKNNYDILSDFMVAQYNSPWALPPFRKNEILVMIK